MHTLKDNPMIEVRVLVPTWIGQQLFAIGETTRLHKRDAAALISGASPPRIEILVSDDIDGTAD